MKRLWYVFRNRTYIAKKIFNSLGWRKQISVARGDSTFDVIFILLFLYSFPPLICLICSNPSAVKCFFYLMSSATLHKSAKSLYFIPLILYFFKNGIIIFIISFNFITRKSTHVPRGGSPVGLRRSPPHPPSGRGDFF